MHERAKEQGQRKKSKTKKHHIELNYRNFISIGLFRISGIHKLSSLTYCFVFNNLQLRKPADARSVVEQEAGIQ